ncbi:MAG: hypothetical protein ACREBH_04560 [Candidatus Micrarchaeaceae archaeon]
MATFQETLVESGLSEPYAEMLAGNERFRKYFSKMTAGGFQKILKGIREAYRCTEEHVVKTVLAFPQFAGLDHQRAIVGIEEAYGCTKGQAVKAVLAYPQFAGRDHQRAIRDVEEAYGCTKEQAVKAILVQPTFAGLDHQRVIIGIEKAYGFTKGQAVKAILAQPQFAGRDHQRAIIGIEEAYGCTKGQASKAVLAFPSFACLDHQRVARQLLRIGRMAGLSAGEVKDGILKNPVSAGYSAKRYLAAVDIARHLNAEGIGNNEEMLHVWKIYIARSPYVPETNRLRITQAIKQGLYKEEPPLMKIMRRRAQNKQATV